jgi:outer membrane lipoprotein-sorting protein
MTKGAQAVAKLTSIHLRGQVRSAPADNFGSINPDSEFYAIELWKQFEPDLKWRVEKPGLVVVMDGQSTVIFNKSRNVANKRPQPSSSAFDTDWLHRIANLGNTISNELNNAQIKGWKLDTTEETAANGRMKSIVTIHAKSDIPENDYVKNSFFDNADTRRVYRFDAQTKLLEAVQVYLVRPSGEVLIFELSQIDYNQSIDPSVFQIELPANVNWYKEELPKLADNDKYANMTAQESARALFEACGREDWVEAGKFFPMPVPTLFRQYLGGLQLISVGEPFNSKGAGPSDVFVPYELKLKDGSVKQMNLHLRKDTQSGRWFYCGGI